VAQIFYQTLPYVAALTIGSAIIRLRIRILWKLSCGIARRVNHWESYNIKLWLKTY